jgi:hypothetical protein
MEHRHEGFLFLKEKIEEIKVALFRAESESVLQLPNNIISTLKVDDEGFIWFYTSCPDFYAPCLEKELYASLYYYQKGNNCLQISGKASVENAPMENELNRKVLLRVKIYKAQYFHTMSPAKNSIVNRIKSVLTHLTHPNNYGTYDFSP